MSPNPIRTSIALAIGLSLASQPAAGSDGAGSAASWQAARRPHANLEVNLANGNLLLQLVTSGYLFGGLEPAPAIQLSLNSLSAGQPGDFTAGWDLGPGWSSTLGEKLEFPTAASALLTLADGTEVAFTDNAGTWVPAAGYYLDLESDGSGWIVRDRSQMVRRFDASGDLTALESASGNAYTIQRTAGEATSVVDPSGRGASFTLDATGRLETMTDSGGQTWYFDYDAAGRLDHVDDPEYGTIDLTYDVDGRLATFSDLDDNTWSFDYVDGGAWDGRIETITDPAGLTEEFDYVAGPITDRTLFTDTRGETWRYFFDREASPGLKRIKNPLGKKWHFARGVDRLLDSMTDPLGETWSYTYDAEGRVLSHSDPVGHGAKHTYDTLGNLLTTTVDGKVTAYTYGDPLHPTRVTKIEEPKAPGAAVPTTTLTWHGPTDGPVPGRWSGLLATVTDAEGGESRYTYDDVGILSMVEEGPIGATGGIQVRYDLASHPVFTDLGGMGVPANFPTLPGLPTQLQGELSQDLQGSLVTDWRGNLASLMLDVEVPIDSGSGWEASTHGAGLDVDHRGRRIETSTTGDEEYAHVATPPGTPLVRDFTTTYDDSTTAAPIVTTAPDGSTVTYQHDAAGRIESMAAARPGGSTLSATYAYDDSGRLASVTRNDGTSTQLTHHANGQVDMIVHRWGLYAILTLDHDYDARGLPTTITETSPRGVSTKTFEHDERGQLVRETRTIPPTGTIEERRYAYDLVGNRTGTELWLDGSLVETSTYHHDLEDPSTYLSANNRLTWVERKDATGALLETTWLFYENPFGHVSRLVVQAAGSTDFDAECFAYDEAGLPWLSWSEAWTDTGSGPTNVTRSTVLETRQSTWRQRLWRVRDGGTFAPLAGGEWVTREGLLASSYAVDDQDGSVTESHLDLDGFGRLQDTGTRSFGTDSLNSIRLRTTGSAILDQEATAFGESLDADLGTDFGLAGGFGVRQLLDGGAWSGRDMVRMGFRNYDPDLGRFLMRDPLGIFGGIDVYAFVGNSPMAFVDPKGLSKQTSGPGEGIGWPPSRSPKPCKHEGCDGFMHVKEWRHFEDPGGGYSIPIFDDECPFFPSEPPRFYPQPRAPRTLGPTEGYGSHPAPPSHDTRGNENGMTAGVY